MPKALIRSLLCLSPLLMIGAAAAQDLLKDRARWEYTDPKSKEKHTLTGWVPPGMELTVGPGATVNDRKKIGTWMSTGPDSVQLNVTDEKHRLHGTIKMKLKPNTQPVTYEGELERKKGKKGKAEKEHVVFQLYKD